MTRTSAALTDPTTGESRKLDRAYQLLSAASMALEPAEYRDAENAESMIEVRIQIDRFLPEGHMR